MVKIRDVIDVMETWAPSSLAESWDNTGLIIGDHDRDVSHIIATLDVTEEAVAAAEKAGASLVISHHPPIFKPLYNLTEKSIPVHVIKHALKKEIALFTAHTNLDQAPGGVSFALAEKLGIQSVTFLSTGTAGLVKFVTFAPPEYIDRIRRAAGSAGAGIIGEYSLCSFTAAGTGTYMPSENSAPFEGKPGKLSQSPEDRIEMIVPTPYISKVVEAARKAHPYEEMAYDIIPLSNSQTAFGYGAVGNLESPMDQDAFLDHVSRVLERKSLTVSSVKNGPVKRVAVMGGSGGNYIGSAVSSGADVYVTGDIEYHEFISRHGDILLVDATHRATELPVLEKIRERLHLSEIGEQIKVTVFSGVDVIVTKYYN